MQILLNWQHCKSCPGLQVSRQQDLWHQVNHVCSIPLSDCPGMFWPIRGQYCELSANQKPSLHLAGVWTHKRIRIWIVTEARMFRHTLNWNLKLQINKLKMQMNSLQNKCYPRTLGVSKQGTVKLRLGKTPSFFHEVWRDHFLSGSVVFHLDKYQDHTKSPSPDVRMPHIFQGSTTRYEW